MKQSGPIGNGGVKIGDIVQRNGKYYKAKTKKVAVDPGKDYLYGSKKLGGTYTTWNKGQGFLRPDLGEGTGAGIPYQALQKKIQGKDVGYLEELKNYKPPTPPKPKRDTHFTYRVRRGDTLSDIANKYGMGWKDLWWYNMHTRNKNARNEMASRGPDLIYKGSAFYVPTGDARVAAIRRRLLG